MRFINKDVDLSRKVMSGADFMDATTVAVKTIGRQHKLKVSFVGNGASTDGETCYLPSISPDHMMTLREAEVGRGYANHEMLHVLMTDMKFGKEKINEWERNGLTFTRALANAIEDVRIEAGGCRLYSGIAKSLDQVSSFTCEEFINNILPENPDCMDSFNVLPVAVTWCGRKALGYPSEPLDEAISALSEDVRCYAETIAKLALCLDHGVVGIGNVDREAAYEGSRQAMLLAEKLSAEVAKRSQQPPPCEGGDGDGTDESEQKCESNDSEDQQSDEQETGEQTAQTSDEKVEDSSSQETDESKPFDPDDAMKDIAKMLGEGTQPPQLSDDGKFCPAFRRITSDDDVYRRTTKKNYLSTFSRMRDDVIGPIATMKRKLHKVFAERSQVEWQSKMRAGRLDVRHRARNIVLGQENVFLRKQDADHIDCAISFLIDNSGSMGGSAIERAIQSAIALCEVVEALHIPTEIIGYASSRLSNKTIDQMSKILRRGTGGWVYTGLCRVRFTVAKEFHTTYASSKNMMGQMRWKCKGGTPTVEAMYVALQRLKSRPEKRKIMFVITDGKPNGNLICASDHPFKKQIDAQWDVPAQLMKRLGVRASAMGVEVVGIGICGVDMRNQFADWISVDQLSELPGVVTDKLISILTEKKKPSKDKLIEAKAAFGYTLHELKRQKKVYRIPKEWFALAPNRKMTFWLKVYRHVVKRRINRRDLVRVKEVVDRLVA